MSRNKVVKKRNIDNDIQFVAAFVVILKGKTIDRTFTDFLSYVYKHPAVQDIPYKRNSIGKLWIVDKEPESIKFKEESR